MVPQPSTENAASTLSRRQCLAAGVAALGGVPAVGARSDDDPPGVVRRRTYENLRVTDTAAAHDEGRILVGRANPRPEPDEPVRIALTDATGAIRQRASFTPDLPRAAHALPAVVRTEAGYAVAAGPWLARLESDLSLRTVGKKDDGMGAARGTRLVSTPGGFVAGFTEWLPNAFWTWLVGFDADGRYRWHREVNTSGSQALGFLLPGSDGGVVAGGTYPWLLAVDADGSSRRIDIPEELPEATLNAGIRDGDGVVLCSGSAAARLDASYDLDWTREYAPLADEQVGDVAPADDGFLFWTTPADDGDFTLAKAAAGGELQWHHTYRLDTETPPEIHTLGQQQSGSYLVGGGANLSSDGWALTLSDARTPTEAPSTPTATGTATESLSTPTATGTPTESLSTPTATGTATESLSTPTAEPTTTTGPGLGLVAGGAALAGVVVTALRRARD